MKALPIIWQRLGASVGSSPCCSVCGDSPCRTLEVGASTFEVIPEELFLRAGLIASSQLLSVTKGSSGG
jgi:hypothetical protein